MLNNDHRKSLNENKEEKAKLNLSHNLKYMHSLRCEVSSTSLYTQDIHNRLLLALVLMLYVHTKPIV